MHFLSLTWRSSHNKYPENHYQIFQRIFRGKFTFFPQSRTCWKSDYRALFVRSVQCDVTRKHFWFTVNKSTQDHHQHHHHHGQHSYLWSKRVHRHLRWVVLQIISLFTWSLLCPIISIFFLSLLISWNSILLSMTATTESVRSSYYSATDSVILLEATCSAEQWSEYLQ